MDMLRQVLDKLKIMKYPLVYVMVFCFIGVFFLGLRRVVFSQTSVNGLTAKGVAAFQQLTLDKAIISWQEAIELDPAKPELRYNLAQALESTGDFAGAEKEYLEVLRLNPQLVAPRYNLANLYLEQGQLDKAEAQLLEGVKAAPYFSAAHFLLGKVYQQKGSGELALGEFQTVIRLAQNGTLDLSEVYFAMGNVYLNLNEPDNAEKAWEKTLELQPDHKQAKEGIARLQRDK